MKSSHCASSLLRPVPLFAACALAILLHGGQAFAADAPLPTQASPALASTGLGYTVRGGDTPASITRAMGLSGSQWQAVADYNHLDARQALPAGTVLRTPLTLLSYKTSEARLLQTVGNVSVNGQPVNAGVRLAERSRIATGPYSSALLVLDDGSQIKLMPQSVVNIEISRHYQVPATASQGKAMQWFAGKMRLLQGALEAAVEKTAPRARPLEVETLTSLIGVRGTRFRVAAADPTARQDRAEVLQGTVHNANTWKQSGILLPAGHGAAVDPNSAEIQAVPLLPALKLPADSGKLTLPDAMWSFDPLPGYGIYRVIVAQDPAFDSVVLSEKLAGTSVDLGQLQPGTWHIRVRAVDEHGLEGQDSDTRILVRAPDYLLENASLYHQNGALFLRWNRVNLLKASEPTPSTVRATVYRDAARTQIIGAPVSTTHRQLALPMLAQGNYWLQIEASHPTLAASRQQVYRIHIPGNMDNMAYHQLLELGAASSN